MTLPLPMPATSSGSAVANPDIVSGHELDGENRAGETDGDQDETDRDERAAEARHDPTADRGRAGRADARTAVTARPAISGL